MEDVERVESLLRRAHQTAGLAAYQYFFIEGSLEARETYRAAMEAEAEAEALLALLRGENA